MARRHGWLRALAGVALAAMGWAACNGSGDSGGPTGPTAPTPPSQGTVVNTNGCQVTYACPNADINGGASPSTPTFNQLTLSTGTSESCRYGVHRNTPDPGIPIQFTIRNAQNNFSWRFREASDLATTTPRSGDLTNPTVQATAFTSPIANTKTGLNFTQNLVLEITQGTHAATDPAVAACGVTIWATFPSGQWP